MTITISPVLHTAPTHLRQGKLVFLKLGHHLPEPHHLRRLQVKSLPQNLEVAGHPADVELQGGPLDRFQAAPEIHVLVGVRLWYVREFRFGWFETIRIVIIAENVNPGVQSLCQREELRYLFRLRLASAGKGEPDEAGQRCWLPSCLTMDSHKFA